MRHIVRLAVAAGFALSASAALAHAQLEKATPPVGGSAPPPSEIKLEFSEGVEPKFTNVALASASGAPIALAKPALDASDDKVLTVKILKPLAEGVYTVTWKAVSVDTHHTQGTFTFTVKP